MNLRVSTFAFSIAVLMAGLSSTAAAQHKVAVGVSVPVKQQVSIDKIDHTAWHQLLQTYVNQQGEVNYKAWHASVESRQSLDSYINSLSTASLVVEATRESQFAFWINAYNAVTVKGILQQYPTTSIRNHTSKFGGYNIWDDLLLTIGGGHISLNDMEHKVLRKMGDPRIHFAIVCASHSCPRLLNQAYTAADLENQLVANTKAFFANQENFQYDARARQFKLSSIMDWFKDDFGTDQAARLKTIAPYLPTQQAYNAAIANSVTVSTLKYDWSLNEQKQAQQPQQATKGSSRR